MNEKTDFGFKTLELIVLTELQMERIFKLIKNNNEKDTELAYKKLDEIFK